ncbi:MAG: (Fe-S)-binding protein, partial [Gammaproteobacteria bacterium]|nr:(Fe-S)-binding protein [Gammaproteobacteria bacterium]
RGLLALPKRYLVDLHDVVARDKYIARAHVATAGGFVAILLLMLVIYLLGIRSNVFIYTLPIAAATMFLGAVFVALRRLSRKSESLSQGGWNRLALSLALLAIAVLGLQLGVGAASQLVFGALLLWGLAEILMGAAWGGPMKHAFAGALHLAFHPRPGRFTGTKLDSGLQPLELDSPKLGVENPSDFPWNRLLAFDACVECGRCEVACPAYAAQQPLSPKKFIQDLVVGLSGPRSDANYRGNGHPGRAIGQAHGAPDQAIVPGLIGPDTVWSCTTCRACVYECPMMIEHVDAIIDIRRFLTMEQGKTPGKGAQVLEDLRYTDNPGGFAPNSRMDWASDQNLPRMADKQQVEVLFWVGDAAFDLRNQRVLKAVVALLRIAAVDFAVLGEQELDIGDVARRLGDDALFQDLAQRNIATLSKYNFGRIVTCDPHVLHCLKNEYPAMGGRYQVEHHTTFFARLIREHRLRIRHGTDSSVTYHDPCYLGRYNGEIEAPRFLLQQMGFRVAEMERSGMRSRCCGAGGGAALTDIPGKQRIPDMRMEDVRATGTQMVAVACPNCAVMLEGVVQPRPDVKDVAELLVDAVGVGQA